MNTPSTPNRNAGAAQGGFSLIELMVALLIGLLVVSAAGTIFISNRQTYAATESLGRIQENGRIAFELMARDLREAGTTPCGNNVPIANVLENPAAANEFGAGDGLRGYGPEEAATAAPFGGGVGQRVAGTQAIEFRSTGNSGVTVTRHNPASAVIFTGGAPHDFQSGDILIVCDFSQAAIFEVSNVGGALQIVHNTGNSTAPGGGNACKALSFPVDPDCKAKPKDGYQYADNATIARLSSMIWYVGNNSRGGRSLYRRMTGRAAEEVTEGVDALTFNYLGPAGSSYVPAASITAGQWPDVRAVRVGLRLVAAEGALRNREIQGTDGEVLTRDLVHTVTLRGRNP